MSPPSMKPTTRELVCAGLCTLSFLVTIPWQDPPGLVLGLVGCIGIGFCIWHSYVEDRRIQELDREWKKIEAEMIARLLDLLDED